MELIIHNQFLLKNVVHREIFYPHSQIERMEDIDEICALLNDTFPNSQLTMTSPLLDTVTPAKRESVLSDTDGKGKVIKLNEFNNNTPHSVRIYRNTNGY